MKYTMTQKRKDSDTRKTNWKKRAEIFKLRRSGHTFSDIAAQVGTSYQNVMELYNKIDKLNPSEKLKLIKSLD